MKLHSVKVIPSKTPFDKKNELAYRLAELAAERPSLPSEVEEMLINRVIDNAAVAIAAINRRPVKSARLQALSHPRSDGATLFGMKSSERVSAEWAAWANGVAVRELDMHDTFLAADYSHPADNIPPILAVAQSLKKSGSDVLYALATAYEIHISLVKAICLHQHKKDHIAHLAPAQAAGIGTLLELPVETIYQAIQQAVHVSFTTRQSRKGLISSWKAYAPAHAGKLAIEAVDRAMHGEGSPSPVYEGEDSVIAWMLDGKEAHYEVPLVEKGEARKSILESYTKEHSAEYQSQALIDLAFRLREKIGTGEADFAKIEKIIIHTSHHTHYVIGTGSNDPQKFDPNASRETLDHSIMYIFAVALEDGRWHHVDSYTKERANRNQTVTLWKKIETREDPLWTKRYHSADPKEKSFGGRVEVHFRDGSKLEDEILVANAHPLGKRPFARAQYIEKFRLLTESLIDEKESKRFLEVVQNLKDLRADGLTQLNVEVLPQKLEASQRERLGIF